MTQKKLRNLAIIAHIDHGKTTLLDALLKHARIFRDNEHIPERAMDHNDQEKERGITIFAKHTSLPYKDFKINIIDTPGHSDFSGEVERVLGMVSSVLLVIDAQDGPMPQTRYVLSKALQMGLKPVVVINKIDRPHANPDKALDLTFDLFVELGATNEQLDFRYCYSSALSGYAMQNINDPREDMGPLFELILEAVPAPDGDSAAPFHMQVMTVEYDDYLGRQATGRVLGGKVVKGQKILCVNTKGEKTLHTVTKIQGYHGLKKVELNEALTGDIVNLSGVPEVLFGDTLCDPDNIVSLPPIRIDEATLSVNIMVNSSPFAGMDGKNVTFNKIKDRLLKEKRKNLSLRIEENSGQEEVITVYGRGELQLAVLIEDMRREGLEFTISKPQVLIKEIDGEKHEPIERVYIDTPEEFSGAIIEELARRKGEMQALDTDTQGISHLQFLIPMRGLMGFRGPFLTMTRGLGIMASLYEGYQPWKGSIPQRVAGVLIASSQGKATTYAIGNLQKRGILFVSPGDEVYEGMVVGEHSRDNDLIVNITKAKQLTNVRAAGSDENILVVPARKFTLEQAIPYIEDDEYIEITPHFLRLRKKVLKQGDRKQRADD